MIYLIFPHGGLGHTFLGLVNYCTKEGGKNIAELNLSSNNQHHISSKIVTSLNKSGRLITPSEYKWATNLVVSSSNLIKYRILILVMGFLKTDFVSPPSEQNLMFSLHEPSEIGEQIELLAKGLYDVILSTEDWYTNAGKEFDISWYWENTQFIKKFLTELQLTVIADRIDKYSNLIREANQQYYDKVEFYFKVVDSVINKEDRLIELSFYECGIVYALLLNYYKTEIYKNKLLKKIPTNTLDFYNIFH